MAFGTAGERRLGDEKVQMRPALCATRWSKLLQDMEGCRREFPLSEWQESTPGELRHLIR